jgi:hypothetical protein
MFVFVAPHELITPDQVSCLSLSCIGCEACLLVISPPKLWTHHSPCTMQLGLQPSLA